MFDAEQTVRGSDTTRAMRERALREKAFRRQVFVETMVAAKPNAFLRKAVLTTKIAIGAAALFAIVLAAAYGSGI